ncbi:hypothetical protein [Thomasclavelia sp.]|uniref:hypothetical protein n=1 Tax=Thomasclavelia sp. TaxID=3025757 RepID=UPI0025E102E7|nr:hypothetical protein [Thomasclavelia sp.]
MKNKVITVLSLLTTVIIKSISNVFALEKSNTNLPGNVLILLVPFMLGLIYMAFKNETK